MRKDRNRAAEQGFSLLNVSPGGDRDLGDPLEILDLRGDHHIHVLGASHDAPGIDGQAPDDDKFDVCLG